MTKLVLYKKTHCKTGLKYLGYTSQDLYSYRGSEKAAELKQLRAEAFKQARMKKHEILV